MRFAVIEDNETLANGIAHQLRDQGHAVDVLHDGAEALDFLRQDSPDFIILDVNLPSLNGFEIVQALRNAANATPIILLTARGDLKDRVAGLDAGADDYLIKPFDIEELDARIRALIRRKPLESGSIIQLGKLSYDRAGRRLQLDGNDLALTQRELAVFECLFERAGQIVSKTQIADHLYGIGAEIEERVVEVYASRLRKKLSGEGIRIKAARGLGYMMELPK
ncbi:MAG: response regulator transcription factor [Paracoccaceae bacterium]